MNIVVLLKMVPDVVEELVVASDGKSLDPQWLRMILNEPDGHALEQALLLKERHGGTVTVLALDAPEVDEVLFTALAQGADRAVKLAGDWTGIRSLSAVRVFSSFLAPGPGQPTPEILILTGSQAIDDLEGEAGPYLAEILDLPYLGVVSGVAIDERGKRATVIKEFAGGLRGEFELPLPAVLGIQAAEKPPRYVPVARVRSTMRSAKIETLEISPPEAPAALAVDRLYKPEVVGRAEMLEGTAEEVSVRIAELLAEHGLI
ncbi:MAG: electron transfer flavoprotein subunit beta/FixA family protein [Candidatus Tectomicrobia bacterium]|uniref:Electron transfer flavoprotein subunit beta/FixA family protein n=1 Tax=Tectimicrobiota bacterium TaxID=2528274 RepID=A0A932CP73_UNCTE|nr:electron transfer flavoprotein subunit beta/FixA family protein [Candidatus Tectomicrobia bacterium]